MKKIYFVSNNQNKYEEIKALFDIPEIELEKYVMEIEELQTDNSDKLIKHKALVAYREIRRPVLVEHTVLCIEAFHRLPGMQTSYFYSKFGCQDIVDFCNYKRQYGACVESLFCFCDGKQFIIGKGKEEGCITKKIRSTEESFAWDKIFIPYGDNVDKKTYDELGNDKRRRSMRKLAWDDLKKKGKDKFFECFVDENENIQELVELLKQRKVLLFVGAGISASIGFPTWNQLIKELGIKVGYEGVLFQCHGDNMMLAEYVGRNDTESLFAFMQKELSIQDKPEIQDKLRNSEIYKNILELDFPVIYTTNQDHVIEEYFNMNFHKFSKVVKIKDMSKIEPNTTRIMKFHGDIAERESIVLTESQYFERMDFRSFMDIQLQADMLQYHVLFLGYSLSDINIKLLMYLMRKQWGNEEQKKAYIFTATPNQVQRAVFEKNSIVAVSGRYADKKQGTVEFLKDLLKRVKNV